VPQHRRLRHRFPFVLRLGLARETLAGIGRRRIEHHDSGNESDDALEAGYDGPAVEVMRCRKIRDPE
jgi:hypothetical protein